MKERKTRRFPLVLSMLGTVAATAAALHYRNRLPENNPGLIVIEPTPEQMHKVRNGSAILTVRIENGEHIYELIHPNPTDK